MNGIKFPEKEDDWTWEHFWNFAKYIEYLMNPTICMSISDLIKKNNGLPIETLKYKPPLANAGFNIELLQNSAFMRCVLTNYTMGGWLFLNDTEDDPQKWVIMERQVTMTDIRISPIRTEVRWLFCNGHMSTNNHHYLLDLTGNHVAIDVLQ